MSDRPAHAFAPGSTIITKRTLNRAELMPKALKLLAEGKGQHEVALAIGVSSYTVHKWALAEKSEKLRKEKPKPNVAPAAYARGYRIGWGTRI